MERPQMIDKYIIKFCVFLDNSIAWVENLFAPRCKCKKKKKDAQAGPKVDRPIKNVVCRYKRTPWKTMEL